MLRDSPVLRRALATAAAVLVVAGLVAVVVTSGGGDGDDGSRLAGSGATSTTRAPGDVADVGGGDEGETAPETTDTAAPPPTDAPPDTVEGSAGTASPATTAASEAPPGAGEAQDPGPTTPPRAGTYTYSFSREGGGESQSGDARTVVEDQGEADGERRQSVRQEDPDQGSFTSDVVWRGDGAYVMSTTFGEAECDWEPDFRNLATPLAAGVTWSYDTTCTVNFNGTPVKIVRSGEFEVVELTRIEVAGEAVDVWKIESVVNTTFGSFGRSTEDTTAFFSPRHGLPVKSSTRVEGSGQGGQSGTFTDEREIKNLSPQ